MGKSGQLYVAVILAIQADWHRERQDVHALCHFVSFLSPSEGLIYLRNSSNYSAKDTRRLGATIDVDQSTVRFLGSLVLVRSAVDYLAGLNGMSLAD
jgi:hypothetical protein